MVSNYNCFQISCYYLSRQTGQCGDTLGPLAPRGRHDPCLVPRAVPSVEAMAAIVVLDAAAKLPLPVTTLPPTMVPLSRSSRPSTSAFPSLARRCYVLPQRSVSVETHIRNIDCGTRKAESIMIKIG